MRFPFLRRPWRSRILDIFTGLLGGMLFAGMFLLLVALAALFE